MSELGFRTLSQDCKRRGINYSHPLGNIHIVGSLIEKWPPGAYLYINTKCPTATARGSYSSSLAWFISEVVPEQLPKEIDWLCSCDRAEKVIGTILNYVIINSEGPAIVGRPERCILWPEEFETIHPLAGPTS